jgi:hypothetical protein
LERGKAATQDGGGSNNDIEHMKTLLAVVGALMLAGAVSAPAQAAPWDHHWHHHHHHHHCGWRHGHPSC